MPDESGSDSTVATAATCSHGPGCPLPWSLHDWSYEADYATAASIPYEGTDCTADEAVEAVKAVRTTAAAEFLTALGGDVVIEDVAEPGPLPADAVMTVEARTP